MNPARLGRASDFGSLRGSVWELDSKMLQPSHRLRRPVVARRGYSVSRGATV